MIDWGSDVLDDSDDCVPPGWSTDYVMRTTYVTQATAAIYNDIMTIGGLAAFHIYVWAAGDYWWNIIIKLY